ncbi:MAG: hypothetical protein EA380_07730 [Phycisphaeraceae bacterium]|nr:MAG: hypothetical protein EA380_07730 [Phycisphaeraceae bacterium]
MNRHDSTSHAHDAELARIEAMLDAHAEEARHRMPEGLSARVASEAALAARTSRRTPVLARIGFGAVPSWRLAAAIALLIGSVVALGLLIGRTPNMLTPGVSDAELASLDAEVESLWLAVAADPLDNEFTPGMHDRSRLPDTSDDLYALIWSDAEWTASFLEDVL